jgi:hypothetical protein
MRSVINLLYCLALGLSNRILSVVLLLILLTSCEKLALRETKPDDANAIFEDAWTILNERYPFFTVKNMDWDSVHFEYSQRLTENMNGMQFFDLLGDMIWELHDGHTDLHSPVNDWTRFYWPITSEYYNRFNVDVIKSYYLNSEYFTKNAVVAGKIGDIGYVYIGDFVQELSPALAQEIMNYLEGMQKYIFDVRNNTGGSEYYGNNLIRYFVKVKTANKIIKLKNGPGHDDFISFTVYIEPGERTVAYSKIVVLANNVTFSAGNDFINNFSALSEVTFIGEKTGGGGSTPYNYELANGWILRYSSNMQIRPKDNLILDLGIPPDISIVMQQSATSDNILNAAINFLDQ